MVIVFREKRMEKRIGSELIEESWKDGGGMERRGWRWVLKELINYKYYSCFL